MADLITVGVLAFGSGVLAGAVLALLMTAPATPTDDDYAELDAWLGRD